MQITHIFSQDFLHKLINFPKTTLENLFNLCHDSVQHFVNSKLTALDPLVCENACHTRAFILCHLFNKYQNPEKSLILRSIIGSLNEIIRKIRALPPINENTNQTIENYLEEHELYLQLDSDLNFDIKFIFLSHLLTLTKKQFPSSSFMLQEKTCLNALNTLGLVHNKIKSLVSNAQKDLSAMSCQFIQAKSKLCGNKALENLLLTRFDDHKRSYLPQYSTAKVIILNALQNKIPLIIKVSRFVAFNLHDELCLSFIPAPNKNEFLFTTNISDKFQAAIVCGGVINYQKEAEHPATYLNRLTQHSLLQILLANFAAHPQFSGNLRNTPCIYKEALENAHDFKPHIAQEWEEFNQHAYFARKEGCTVDNPHLLFLNHVFCDSINNYHLYNLSTDLTNQAITDKVEL